MAVPTIVDFTGGVDTVAPLTLSLPSHVADDILLIYAETNGSTTISIDQGFAQVTGSPQAAGTSTALHVWWKRATSSESTPTITQTASANHIVASMGSFRGCIATGDPWDLASGGTDGTNDTSANPPTGTTTVNDCLVLFATSTGWDANAGQGVSASAPNLTSVAITDLELNNTVGGGGGFVVAAGSMVTAGALGTLTITLANATTKGLHTLALKPASTIVSLSRTASESISVTDSVARTTSRARTATDGATVSDAAGVSAGKSRSVTEAVSVTDSASRAAQAFTRSASDAVSVSDAVVQSAIHTSLTASEAIGVSDSVDFSQGGTLTRSASESISVSDAVTRAHQSFARSATDALAVSDIASWAGPPSPSSGSYLTLTYVGAGDPSTTPESLTIPFTIPETI